MNHLPKNDTDVLIVGAGPAGLTLACELLRRGVSCRIIDKADAPATTSRALGFQPRTLELFETMGIIDQVLQRGGPVFGASFYEGDQLLFTVGGETIQKLVQKQDVPYPYPWIMPQSDIEAMLTDSLHHLSGAVERSRELVDFREEAETVVATVNTASGPEAIHARWLVGCDGSHSQVRHQLGVSFEGSAYEEHFLLADVDLDWSRGRDKTHTWFHPDGMMAIFPFPGGHQWRIFTDLLSAKGTTAPPASLELFQQLFRERTGDSTTHISNPTWISNFTINRRMVDRYRVGRVFLAGDAAHIHSPFGGQGMNTGIQDAYNLAWKLALVIAGKARATLLDTYDEERRPVAQSVLQQTDANTKVILSKNPVMKFLRERILPLEAFQKYMLRRASELDINYRASSLSSTYQVLTGLADGLGFRFAPHAGDRAPQGYGEAYPSREKAGLFQAFRGTAWHLLLFGGAGQNAALTAIARRAESLLGDTLQAHLIIAANEKPGGLEWEGHVLLDPRRELHKLYGAGASALYLIRPDGYIGFRSQPAAERPLLDYLGKVFQPGTARTSGALPTQDISDPTGN